MRDAELGVELTRHRSAGRPFAVVDVSLRDFQALNDRIGRAAGDTVLTALAGFLTAHASAGATVARLDGDRFSVLLPSSDAEAAERFVARVRASMPSHAGRQELVLTSGVATYPVDGDHDEPLVIAAADRWRSDEGAPTTGRTDGAESPWTLVMTGHELAPPPELPRRVNRRDLAADPLIWRSIGGAFLLYSVVIGAAQMITGELAGTGFAPAVTAAALCAFWMLASGPPKIGTWRNHVAIASAYVLPFGAMLAATPNASWAVSTAFLAPLLTVVRLTDRRQIAAHLAMPPVLCLGLAASGQVDQASIVACLALSVNTWVLGICTAVVFEAAEAQWQEIEGLVLRDPLTGAGNRDLLAQRLAEELPRHDQLQMSLAFLELDLIGFADLVRRDGRGAANHVLRDTALVISGVVGPTATVSRIGGSTFRILLPLADLDDLSPERTEDLLAGLRNAIASTSRRDRHVLPRIGVAMYPEDATDARTLEAVAASRRRADDPYAHEVPAADIGLHGRANVA
ncbi:MAG: diguanylate cyclase [Patulibacter minatonensis]